MLTGDFRDPSVYTNRLNRLREIEQLASPQRTAAYNLYRQNNKRLARADREAEESGGIPPEQRTIAPAIAEATRVTVSQPLSNERGRRRLICA
jgi:hypothetical protein